MNETCSNATDFTEQQPSNESKLRNQIQDLKKQNDFLLRELTAAYHTINTVLEIEQPMNKYEKNWTHSDRRTIAELVIKICQQRLDTMPMFLTRKAISTYVDGEF